MAEFDDRAREVNDRPIRSDGSFVLYWMVGSRRSTYNFALDHACDLAEELGVGVVVLEPLRLGYRWASLRHHQFIVQGMRDNEQAFAKQPVRYYPYVELEEGDGKGLLGALANDACAVVVDDYPCFFIPKMIEAAAKKLPVRLTAVDSNGLYPMRATARVFTTAASFRRHLHKQLPPYLGQSPRPTGAAGRKLPTPVIAESVASRWRPGIPSDEELAKLAFANDVAPVALVGGARAAAKRLRGFLDDGIERYDSERSQPEARAHSSLSPYLHYGHISSHEIFQSIVRCEDWTPERLALKPSGSRTGWWGMSAPAEAFLDELITWREIGFNKCANDPTYADYGSLPQWARDTLREHAGDDRPWLYSLADLEQAATHDSLWNAAQRQLLEEGVIHNYLRMLWGKKILEWTESGEQALDFMIELNNKYAIDGRDPSSYSGIFWVLGRYDRAWGPERPIFGKVRYMSSDSAKRKLRLNGYLKRYGCAQVALPQIG